MSPKSPNPLTRGNVRNGLQQLGVSFSLFPVVSRRIASSRAMDARWSHTCSTISPAVLLSSLGRRSENIGDLFPGNPRRSDCNDGVNDLTLTTGTSQRSTLEEGIPPPGARHLRLVDAPRNARHRAQSRDRSSPSAARPLTVRRPSARSTLASGCAWRLSHHAGSSSAQPFIAMATRFGPSLK